MGSTGVQEEKDGGDQSKALPEVEEFGLIEIMAGHVREALASAKRCGGADGWSVAELRECEPFCQEIMDLVDLIERWGLVPTVCATGGITPKDGYEPRYDQMRPITVMPILHRLYGAIRLRQAMFKWQEEVIARCGD